MSAIEVEKTGTLHGFQDFLNRVLAHEQVKGLLILACEANDFKPESVDPVLVNVPVPLFGGIFPEIIHRREKLTKGTLIVGLSAEPNVQVVPHLSDVKVDYDAVIDEKFPEIGDNKTMFVLVDGLSRRIGELIDSLFNIFGLEVNYIFRVLFPEKEFSQEIEAIYREGAPLVGALSLGEIANSGQDYLEFYNKRAVVGVLEAG